ncbi:MAG: ABC transporter permease [Bacteroidales bacterium]|nr:ABC transporter permease [Bacteroidales bacterium]
MRRFSAFVVKEFRHLGRDIRTVLIISLIPVIQLMLFGHVITMEIKDAGIAVLDPSKDEISTSIINKVLSSGYFRLETEMNSVTEIESLFRKGKVREAIVFERNFGKNLMKTGTAHIQVITDASDPNTAGILDNYTRNIINTYLTERSIGKLSVFIDVQHRMFYNERLRSANMFVPGTIALILMLISTLMTSISITREKELGTMEILLVSPLKPIQIILGKVVPYMTLAFFDSIVIIAMGYFVFHVPVHRSILLLFGLCLLYIFLALSIGILISTISKTQQVAMIISLVGLMLPTVLLSGFIFPIDNMPKILQFVSIFMPPRWFLSALKDIMLKGVGLGYIWKDIVILISMLIGFILLSVKNFRIRLS